MAKEILDKNARLVEAYKKQQKQEADEKKTRFISLLNDIVAQMKFFPDKLNRNSILEYNELFQQRYLFQYTPDEKEKVQSLFNTLNSLIKKNNDKEESEKKVTEQEQLLYYLKQIRDNWQQLNSGEKLEYMAKVNFLQMKRGVMSNMTPEQKQLYKMIYEELKSGEIAAKPHR